MRRRDLTQLQVPQDWRQRAEEATAAVVADQKKLKDFDGIWGELKQQLAALSFGKCWYCEARQTRADNAVDHFRPKSKYPWRAFRPENFRFACTYCNSRRRNPATDEVEGKGDFFPLISPSLQAEDESKIDLEYPVLLDPCIAADCGLLDFRMDGTPCPFDAQSEVVKQRVTESIRYYHLDHPELVDERRKLGLELNKTIRQADRLYPRYLMGEDLDVITSFEKFVEEIATQLADRAEMSAYARRVVKTHRSKPWIEPILDTA